MRVHYIWHCLYCIPVEVIVCVEVMQGVGVDATGSTSGECVCFLQWEVACIQWEPDWCLDRVLALGKISLTSPWPW